MSAPDWDQRQLCPDGGCVGVIGPTGTCKVCGRAAQNWGDERRRGLKTTGEHPAEDTTPLPAPDPGDDHGESDEPRPEGWDDRRLCPNDACIGLLDATGRCKVCGTVDESAGSQDEDDEDDEDDDEASAASADSDDEDEEEDDEDEEEDDEDEEEDDEDDEDAAASTASDDDLAERKLCPDGACVGVIGADQRCKLCGKAVE